MDTPCANLAPLPCISTSQANTTQEFFHTLGVQHIAAFDHFLPAKSGIRDPVSPGRHKGGRLMAACD